jgi:hypothetical protein
MGATRGEAHEMLQNPADVRSNIDAIGVHPERVRAKEAHAIVIKPSTSTLRSLERPLHSAKLWLYPKSATGAQNTMPSFHYVTAPRG